MRILLVAHKFPPFSLGGVEIYTQHLAQALAERHEVAVFFRHDAPGADAFTEIDGTSGDAKLRYVSLSPRGHGARAAREFWSTFRNRDIEASFDRWLSTFEPDLVHFQHVMALSAHLISIARATGVPVLLTLHDYWFLCGNSQLIWPDGQVCRGKACGLNCVRCAAAARFPYRIIHWLRPALAPLFLYRDRVVRHAALQAHRLLSPSQFLIDRYTSAGFPARRFTFLENGIPAKEKARYPRLAESGTLRVTFIGSLAWQKGVHILAQAWRGLPTGIARLRIWGDPAVFPEYSARVRALLEGTGAVLMGRIPNQRVGEVLAESDVVVVPSLWYENSPVIIQEARAAGVPVIASRQGALQEKIHDGVDGLLFPPGDAGALRQAILRLSQEPGLLAQLRSGVPPAMDISEHVVRLERVYEQVGHPDPML